MLLIVFKLTVLSNQPFTVYSGHGISAGKTAYFSAFSAVMIFPPQHCQKNMRLYSEVKGGSFSHPLSLSVCLKSSAVGAAALVMSTAAVTRAHTQTPRPDCPAAADARGSASAAVARSLPPSRPLPLSLALLTKTPRRVSAIAVSVVNQDSKVFSRGTEDRTGSPTRGHRV